MVEYEKNSKPQYDLILGNEAMKELGTLLDFTAKMMTIDEVILPIKTSTFSKVLAHSCAKAERQLSHGTIEHIGSYHTGDSNIRCQIQQSPQSIVRDNCKHLSAKHQKKLLQLYRVWTCQLNNTWRWV